MEEAKEPRKVAVRLEAEDERALEFVVDHVRARSGRGVKVSDSDAVRWALHTCWAAFRADGTPGGE